MTLDQLYYNIQVGKVIEFTHNGKNYRLFSEKDSSGNSIIKFGPNYEEEIYSTYGELINKAYVENHLLRYFIENV